MRDPLAGGLHVDPGALRPIIRVLQFAPTEYVARGKTGFELRFSCSSTLLCAMAEASRGGYTRVRYRFRFTLQVERVGVMKAGARNSTDTLMARLHQHDSTQPRLSSPSWLAYPSLPPRLSYNSTYRVHPSMNNKAGIRQYTTSKQAPKARVHERTLWEDTENDYIRKKICLHFFQPIDLCLPNHPSAPFSSSSPRIAILFTSPSMVLPKSAVTCDDLSIRLNADESSMLLRVH